MTDRGEPQVVEVEPSGVRWIKSSASGGATQGCVEMALVGNTVLVRNSRNRSGSHLAFPAWSWAAFVAR